MLYDLSNFNLIGPFYNCTLISHPNLFAICESKMDYFLQIILCRKENKL
jgi:hypothetical protein